MITPADSAARVQAALIADAKICLGLGMSGEEWRARVNLLIMYSLPPELVDHVQDSKGEWHHRLRGKPNDRA